ncbi:MAG: D-glycero-beta-D-manno-heptose 1,7-bisphosphate 7-phosphatase [Betaproteobacteria bacterium]|nr:D-glycero-beta-D-manno-heptose 1,7-bisphosphate 7-phosphatase [Betaproteobacteria bacterium]
MKLIILDRDGVINQDSDKYIKSPAEWQPIPGSIEAIARLHQGGYRIVVATNQSGIGRGLFDMATFNAMNDKMMELVFRQGGRIDALFFCPHTDVENCNCRKPRTGMYEEIAARYHMDLKGVPCVGDAMRDLKAAEAVGGQPILVLTGKGEKTRAEGGLPRRTQVYADLAEVSRHIVAARE